MFIMCCCRDVAVGAVCLSCAAVEMWQVFVCLSCAAVEMWQVLCVYHVLL